MKKILFLGLAAATFAACSQDDAIELNRQEIGFGEVFIDNATRVVDQSYGSHKLIDGFNVWGTVQGNASTVNLYQGASVTRGTKGYNEAWNCTQTEYWIPAATYNFAAVANHTSVEVDNGLPKTISFDYFNGKMDLLYTKVLKTVTTDDAAEPSGLTNNCVAFTFNHLLSKLHFEFTNTSGSANYIYKVKNIQISGLPTKGTYTIGEQTPWLVSGNTGTASFGNATNATTTGADAADIKYNATQPITSNEALMVIPGNYAITITFVCELYYDADGEGNESSPVLIYSDENKTTGNKYTEITMAAREFAENTAYVLKADLEPGTQINFTVSVLDTWTNETPGIDIN